MRLSRLLVAVVLPLGLPLSLLTAACATEEVVDTDDVEASDDGKTDAASELYVRASETSLWVTRALERRGDTFVLRGRTSRTITDGNAFIWDDVYGAFAPRTARTYEVTYTASELRGLVDGVNLFAALHFAPSPGRPEHLTARTVVRPRIASTTGPSSLALTAELTPVVVAGRTVYRLKGRSTKALTAVATTAGDARLVDATHYEIDLDFDQLVQLTDPAGDLAITVTQTSGPATVRATLGLAVKKLGLTAKDIEHQYPSPQCTAAKRACLLALPDGALDLASCGEAITVRVCNGQVGLRVDAAALADARATATTKLAPLATDAIGLVGADRAADLAHVVSEVINGRLDAVAGLWLITPAARTSVLATAVDLPVDEAYAYPTAFVDGHEAAPGDVAATRQVAADAVLGYLKTQDYAHSELGRSYLELTRVFRANHVASLRAFRESAERVTFPNEPNLEHYVGAWIGLYTEVTIDRTTGEPTTVLVELD